MGKLFCSICHKELGAFAGKVKLSDGVICLNCLNDAGISVLSNNMTYNQQSINELINSRKSMVKSFLPTKTIGDYLQVDENHSIFKVNKDIFTYKNLLCYELLEDDQTITKGGLGSAVVGGLLFGGVGAIVGSVTGEKKSKGICNSMKLRISLKNAHTDVVYINFIRSETKTNGFIYKSAQDSAQKCITALETINDINQTQLKQPVYVSQTFSFADEIAKFKNLLDQNIITQEQFEIKKNELLQIDNINISSNSNTDKVENIPSIEETKNDENISIPNTEKTELTNNTNNEFIKTLNSSNAYNFKSQKNKWVTFLLCFFLGFLGAHKFYEGKVGMGILYIFTMGLFGFGWLVDIILILFKPNPYYV